MEPLCLGVIAQSNEELQYLKQQVALAGHSVEVFFTLDNPGDWSSDPPSAWLLEINDQDMSAELADWLYLQHEQDIPVLLIEAPRDSEERPAWRKRLAKKLLHLPGIVSQANYRKEHGQDSPWPKQVWLLLASTGGPEAVGEFLRALPPELNIAFVYVQHIDEGFSDSLLKAIARDSAYPVRIIEHGSLLKAGEVAVISPERFTELLDNGTFIVEPSPWRGPYSPSMEQVLANFSMVAGSCSAIVFSGMGNDGAMASRLLKRAGGQLWCQEPTTCACASMPESVMALDYVDYCAEPRQLAANLADINRGQLIVHKLHELTKIQAKN